MFRGWVQAFRGVKGKGTLRVTTCMQSLGQEGVTLHRSVFQQSMASLISCKPVAKAVPCSHLPWGSSWPPFPFSDNTTHPTVSLPTTVALQATRLLQA